MSVPKNSVTYNCLICDFTINHVNAGKLFSTHLKKSHNLSSEEYIVKHFYNGFRPLCAVNGCQNITRFTRDLKNPENSIQQFCHDHAKIAMSLGGHKGALKITGWNKGHTKYTHPGVMKQAQSVMGEKNHFFGQHHTPETIQKIIKSKTLETNIVQQRIEDSKNFEPLTDLSGYVSRQKQHLEVKCLTCGEVQFKTLQSIERQALCFKCHRQMKSIGELEVYDFVKAHCSDVISGDYSVLGGHKQLDIFVPSKNFAIEYNGLYYHSERENEEDRAKYRHIDKTEKAAIKHVQLMHIFSDEWKNKQEICKSMILHRLGLQSTKIHTRKCEVVELTKHEQRDFFNVNHIAGSVGCQTAFGLKLNNEIVAALSLRIPFQNKKKCDQSYLDYLEIGRFCTKTYTNVPGALSRLLKSAQAYVVAKGYNKMMTYADRRFGVGNGYEQAGFKKIRSTTPDFWYANSDTRYHRLKFRADKKNGLTEKQVAKTAGVARIYGCGSFVYIKTL